MIQYKIICCTVLFLAFSQLTQLRLTAQVDPASLYFPMRSTEVSVGAVYVFTDVYSCFTCNLTLQSLSTYCKDRNFPFVVFLSKVDPLNSKRFVERELVGINDVVIDELEAYAKLFQITQTPMLLVLGKNGRLAYREIPGRTSFNIEFFMQAITNVVEEVVVDTTCYFPGIDTLRLDYVKSIISVFDRGQPNGTSMVFTPQTGKYFFMDHAEKALFKIDRNGHASDPVVVQPSNNRYRIANPMLMGVTSDTNEAVIWDTDFHSAMPYVMKFNYSNMTAKYIDVPKDWMRVATRMYYNESDSLRIMLRRITDGNGPFIIDSGVIFYTTDTSWKTMGQFNRFFYDTLTAGWGWATATWTGKQIAIHQNFMSTIELYDLSGRSTGEISLSIPNVMLNMIRYIKPNADSIMSAKGLQSSLAYRFRDHNLFYDAYSDRLLLTLMVRMGQISADLRKADSREFQSVLLIVDLDKRLQDEVVQLPINTIIHGVYNGVIYGVTQRQGVLSTFESYHLLSD